MVTTSQVLQFMFPSSRPLSDWTVFSARSGEEVVGNWNPGIGQQPSSAEIDAARRQAAVAIATEAIKTERDKRKFAGVYVGASRFQSDPDSRTQQLGLVLLGANLPLTQWKIMGGGFVTMTPALAQQIFAATAMRDIAVFAAAEKHIAAAALADDPLAYDYSTGWPV